MKKKFENPEVSVCIFDVEDVITVSGTGTGMELEGSGSGGESDY